MAAVADCVCLFLVRPGKPIVEVMGHRQFAGFVGEQAIGGASFLRVHVPEVKAGKETLPGFTKLLGAGSIYAISPCTEETARAYAAQSRQRSFSVYEAPRLPAPIDRTCRGCGEPIEDCTCEPEKDEDDLYDEEAAEDAGVA